MKAYCRNLGGWGFLLLTVGFFCFGSELALAGEILPVKAVICTSIQEKEPVGAGTEFPVSVKQVFCFTALEAASAPTRITHVWYYSGKKVHEFTVPVNSSKWRTWTSKNIFPGQTGDWKVDIVETDTQKVILSVPFTVK